MEAIAHPPAYDRACAAVRYDDVARTLVHRFKYVDRLDLAPVMGRWMARRTRTARRSRCVDSRAAALTKTQDAAPQPVGGADRAIAQASHVLVMHSALKRVRATAQQVDISKAERSENVQGTFRVPPEEKAQVAGRRLILIDDVLTFARVVSPMRATI
jgi:predicted amidophosphoribosyltransferase